MRENIYIGIENPSFYTDEFLDESLVQYFSDRMPSLREVLSAVDRMNEFVLGLRPVGDLDNAELLAALVCINEIEKEEDELQYFAEEVIYWNQDNPLEALKETLSNEEDRLNFILDYHPEIIDYMGSHVYWESAEGVNYILEQEYFVNLDLEFTTVGYSSWVYALTMDKQYAEDYYSGSNFYNISILKASSEDRVLEHIDHIPVVYAPGLSGSVLKDINEVLKALSYDWDIEEYDGVIIDKDCEYIADYDKELQDLLVETETVERVVWNG